MFDVIIIGSGPAGLAAAIYACRAGIRTLVIEKNPMSGGQIVNTYEVDNYPGLPGISGFDLGVRFHEHAEKLGASFVEEEVTHIENRNSAKVVYTDHGKYETKNVILATGAQHALLGVDGEKELNGIGVSYCATCDGAFFKNKTVAVVGGGDVALEDAIFLAKICKKVYVIHRRDSFRGAKILEQEMLSYDNVEILWNTEVTKIDGNDCVEGLQLYENQKKENSQLAVDGVFIAVGICPDTELLKGIVEMDESGYVIASEDCRTSVPGIFVAGDARKKPLRQVVTAVADGANAIQSVLF